MNAYANPLIKTLARWGGFAALLAVIAATSLHSYVLFHSLVEIFRIVVIFGIAALAWNARSQIDHPFLLVSGLAYPAVGVLELLHTLAYKGMGIFAADANLPTQLWIAFRGYESLAMLIAACLLAWRNLPVAAMALGFLGAGAALGWLVLSGHFPDCFVEGSGLTAFKIGAEYVIAAVFALSLWLIWRRRSFFSGDILALAVVSIVCDILAELAFTHYVNVYGTFNLIGHLLLLTSTYALYRALLFQGIQQPQQLLFHQLSREKELLALSEARLSLRVKERTAEVTESNRRLQEELAERQRIEQELLESEEMLRLTRNVAIDAVIVINHEGLIVTWNPAATALFGYREDEAVGRSMHDLIVPARYRAVAAEGVRVFGQTGSGTVIGKLSEMTAMRRDGSEFAVELSISAVQIRGQWHAVGIIRDISDRQAAARAREQLAAIVESTREAIVGKDLNGVVTAWNAGAEFLYGYSAGEMLGRSVELLVPGELRPELAELMARVRRGEIIVHHETQRLRKGGELIDVALTLSPINDAGGLVTGLSTVAHDITARKQAERTLRRLNRRLKLLSASNQTLLHGSSEADLLARMCHAITEIGGFQGAWVGALDPQRPGRIWHLGASDEGVAAHFAAADGCPIVSDSPLAEALACSDAVIFRDRSPHPPLPSALAGIALPMGGQGGMAACLTVWATDADLLDEDEIPTLKELAADLYFGLSGLRIKTEKEHGLQTLARTLEDTVRAIAGTVEMRDPYTAGHQRRVAELSQAIGRELGLPEDRVHAISLAAMIHDLGKINIPAEILTRPGRLSAIEYSLIKTHPTAGYEIIKNIEFPWPIGTAMLQHHERLDGSGYPEGLSGDAILLEARIIGAADLVEAMSSHRPYRPGLGVAVALEELAKGRGVTFDSAVVDACLSLFRDKGFEFSKQWGSGQ